jgi:hypothetical protein
MVRLSPSGPISGGAKLLGGGIYSFQASDLPFRVGMEGAIGGDKLVQIAAERIHAKLGECTVHFVAERADFADISILQSLGKDVMVLIEFCGECGEHAFDALRLLTKKPLQRGSQMAGGSGVLGI